MRLINCTPHDVNIVGANPRIIVKSGIIPRVKEIIIDCGDAEGVPLKRKTFGDVEGLPNPENGVLYIVSSLVAAAAKREDLVVPNTVRDASGQIIGCDSFSFMS